MKPSQKPNPKPEEEKLEPEVEAELRRAEKGRRDFIQKASCVLIGGAIVGVPTVIGLRAVTSSLFEKHGGGILARLTTLDALERGGPPQAFKVVADKTDAWTTYANLPLGLVYVQQTEDGDLRVFSASCPHAGCAVEYRTDGLGPHYYCPCHESSFNEDGSLAPDNTQAKRGLDTLEIVEEKLADGEVWIRFQKFKAGIPEKVAVS